MVIYVSLQQGSLVDLPMSPWNSVLLLPAAEISERHARADQPTAAELGYPAVSGMGRYR